jgi:hypothetical protein
VGRTAGLADTEKLRLLTLPGLELGPIGRPVRSQTAVHGLSTRDVIMALFGLADSAPGYEQTWYPPEMQRLRAVQA